MILDDPHIELWLYIMISGCILTISGYQLWRQTLIRYRLIRRTCYILISLIGLGLIILKPHYKSHKLKEHAQINAADNRSEHHHMSIHDILHSAPISYDSVTYDPTMLTNEDLELSQNIHLSPHVDSNIWGLVDISYPNRIIAHRPWQLSGMTQGAETLSITNPISDSMSTVDTEDESFEFNLSAPFAGDYIYDLYMFNSRDDTIHVRIPIHVEANDPWNMLVITNYPTFEVKILKNYWTQQGNGFFWRSTVTRGRYSETAINTPTKNITDLTNKVLDHFDFLMIDIISWNQLSNSERNRINRRVSSDGLGLIIIPNAVDQRAIAIDHPNIIAYHDHHEDNSNSYYSFAKGWKPINTHSTEIARYQDYGLGVRMILSNDQSYRYILRDSQTQYNNIWNAIFSTAYHQYQSKSNIITSKWIWAGEKTYIQLLTEGLIDEPIYLNDSIQVSAIKDPLIDNSYELTIWPKPGYNTISYHGDVLQVYAHTPSDLPLVRLHEMKDIHKSLVSLEISSSYLLSTRLSPIYGFLILLFGLGLLWLDERLY